MTSSSKAACRGVDINYKSTGSGPDVVLIHGLAASHAFWRFDVLRALADGFRVTLYDLRGHGKSGMPPSGYTSGDMAGDLLGLLDHLGVEKAHIAGHSFGGLVGLHFAAVHPERVLSLTVADSRVRALQPLQRAKDWPNWEATSARLQASGIHIPEEANDAGFLILEEIARLRVSGADFPFKLFGGIGGAKTAARWLELLDNTAAREELASSCLTAEQVGSIGSPVLLAYGQKSTLIKTLEGLEARLPHSARVIVPSAGHFFPLTHGAAFGASLREFISAHALQAAG